MLRLPRASSLGVPGPSGPGGAFALSAALLLGALAPASVGAVTSAAAGTTLQDLASIGSTSIRASSDSVPATGSNDTARYEVDRDYHSTSGAPAAGTPTAPADPPSSPVATPGSIGFLGINHRDQRLTNNGNQYSLEPPDQALCVGNGYVLESVNLALRVYSTSGSALTPVEAINEFFGLPPSINRTTGVAGPFTSDPKCLYDASTGRWFLTVLEEDPAPSVRTHTLIAVSQTNDPRGAWSLYSLDATDDGLNGTPANPSCPCFGDQPLIGLNTDGFFISTNEFSATGFNGAQVYAMSKSRLEAGGASLPKVVHLNVGLVPTPDSAGNPYAIWYTLQPANAPAGAPAGKGQLKNTEFFMSALQFGPAPLDNRIAVWALTNTSALVSGNPAAVKLDYTILGTETYGQPPVARQHDGPRPLGSALGEPVAYLNSNDDRMNQVVYANGNLYAGVNTVLGSGATTRAGIAWFIVAPSVSGHAVSASMARQGFISVAGEDVMFPSIGVNNAGKGVMTFTLAGPDNFPSAAYATLDPSSGAGQVTVVWAGMEPADGFTGYPEYTGANVERWGDYSAATTDENGMIWMATELTPGGPRTLLANWGTWVGSVAP